MPDGPPVTAEDLSGHVDGMPEWAGSQVPQPLFADRLRAHFERDPEALPIVSGEFEAYEHPNLQLAIDAYLDQDGRSAEVLGVIAENKRFGSTLSDLLIPQHPGFMGGTGAVPGPVEYRSFELDDGHVLSCIDSGLYLLRDGGRRLAVFMRGPGRIGYPLHCLVDVMGRRRHESELFLAELRTSIRTRNVYRGRVLSLSLDRRTGQLQVHFRKLARTEREHVILPDGVLERVERHTLGFTRHSQKLLAAGRHLKRGLLLHGPPGTGKTLTAMYLAGQMSGRTVLILTGRGLGLIEQAGAIARQLQPSLLVLEDVDLVAEERTQAMACPPLLFELLNEMDGLADDADVIFLLTTNRPDLLEPALASRPGRIDQAVQIPLPDAACRRRLFELYSRGLTINADLTRFVERTAGAGGAFIRELLRKAALFAADEDRDPLTVTDRHLEEALHELVVEGGELTKSLLGAIPPR